MNRIIGKVVIFVRSYPIIAIFLLAVLVRILLIIFYPLPNQFGGNFSLYNRIAESILSQGDFGGEPQKTYGSPFINPGWSFFLAGFYFLFGKSQVALLSASIFFGGLVAVGVYFLSLQFFNKKTSVLAGVIAAIWPAFLIQTLVYTNSLLLYTVLLLWGTAFFARAVLKEQWLYAVASGILIGFAVLVDSIAFFIPVVFLLWALIVRLSVRTLIPISVFFAVLLLIIAPWVYRNLSVGGDLSKTPTISKGELQLISPDNFVLVSKLAVQDGQILSGFIKMFVFPYNISILDQREPYRSYKEIAKNLLSGESVELTSREKTIFTIKVFITILHWILLGLGIFGIVAFRNNKFILFTVLLLGYTVFASIAYGLLGRDNFQGISLLSSFLLPLIPFIIISASAFLSEKLLSKKQLI